MLFDDTIFEFLLFTPIENSRASNAFLSLTAKVSVFVSRVVAVVQSVFLHLVVVVAEVGGGDTETDSGTFRRAAGSGAAE